MKNPKPGTIISKVVALARRGAGPAYIADVLGMSQQTANSHVQYARLMEYIEPAELRKYDKEKAARFAKHVAEERYFLGNVNVAASRIMDDAMWIRMVDIARARGYRSVADFALDCCIDEVIRIGEDQYAKKIMEGM